jgi:CheY-like chemotaxis protein
MKSMLIIDGSVTVATLFAQIFRKRGWSVSTCNDANCAMERLVGSTPYDLVLLSYRVRGTDGVKLVRFIRELETSNDRCCSDGYRLRRGDRASPVAGADDVLIKQ